MLTKSTNDRPGNNSISARTKEDWSQAKVSWLFLVFCSVFPQMPSASVDVIMVLIKKKRKTGSKLTTLPHTPHVPLHYINRHKEIGLNHILHTWIIEGVSNLRMSKQTTERKGDDQRCKMFGLLLCRSSRPLSYDWGGKRNHHERVRENMTSPISFNLCMKSTERRKRQDDEAEAKRRPLKNCVVEITWQRHVTTNSCQWSVRAHNLKVHYQRHGQLICLSPLQGRLWNLHNRLVLQYNVR